MEEIIEEYGIAALIFVIGTAAVAGAGQLLQLIAGV